MSDIDAQRQVLKDAMAAANHQMNMAVNDNRWLDFSLPKSRVGACQAELYHLEKAYRALNRGEPVDVQTAIAESSLKYQETLDRAPTGGSQLLIGWMMILAVAALCIFGMREFHILSLLR
jgi:hypothetical protein